MENTYGNQSQVSKSTRSIFRVSIIALGLLIIAFLGVKVWIWNSANQFAKNAAEHFKTDQTTALLLYLDSDDFTIKQKNKAIWTMGTLKTKEALPKLETMYTGQECDHNSAICQYELYKAIHKIKGDYRGSWKIEPKNS